MPQSVESQAMRCPVCDHRFSYWEALRTANPVRFRCVSCDARLTLDFRGHAATASVCVLGSFLVLVLPATEYAVFRVARLRSRP